MNKLIYTLTFFCVVGLSQGCHAIRSQIVFDVAARNIGTNKLDKVQVEFEGFSHGVGALSPGGGGSQYSLFEGHWPSTANVKWRFWRDRAYMPDRSITISIPPHPKLLPHEKITLWFDLDGKGVTVRVEKVDTSKIDAYIEMMDREESSPGSM